MEDLSLLAKLSYGNTNDQESGKPGADDSELLFSITEDNIIMELRKIIEEVSKLANIETRVESSKMMRTKLEALVYRKEFLNAYAFPEIETNEKSLDPEIKSKFIRNMEEISNLAIENPEKILQILQSKEILYKKTIVNEAQAFSPPNLLENIFNHILAKGKIMFEDSHSVEDNASHLELQYICPEERSDYKAYDDYLPLKVSEDYPPQGYYLKGKGEDRKSESYEKQKASLMVNSFSDTQKSIIIKIDTLRTLISENSLKFENPFLQKVEKSIENINGLLEERKEEANNQGISRVRRFSSSYLEERSNRSLYEEKQLNYEWKDLLNEQTQRAEMLNEKLNQCEKELDTLKLKVTNLEKEKELISEFRRKAEEDFIEKTSSWEKIRASLEERILNLRQESESVESNNKKMRENFHFQKNELIDKLREKEDQLKELEEKVIQLLENNKKESRLYLEYKPSYEEGELDLMNKNLLSEQTQRAEELKMMLVSKEKEGEEHKIKIINLEKEKELVLEFRRKTEEDFQNQSLVWENEKYELEDKIWELKQEKEKVELELRRSREGLNAQKFEYKEKSLQKEEKIRDLENKLMSITKLNSSLQQKKEESEKNLSVKNKDYIILEDKYLRMEEKIKTRSEEKLLENKSLLREINMLQEENQHQREKNQILEKGSTELLTLINKLSNDCNHYKKKLVNIEIQTKQCQAENKAKELSLLEELANEKMLHEKRKKDINFFSLLIVKGNAENKRLNAFKYLLRSSLNMYFLMVFN